MDNELNHQEEKEPWLSPNRISMGGKFVGMVMILGGYFLHIFTSLEFSMTDIMWSAVTMASLGAPVDFSYIINNFGQHFGKR
ncbi:hypothetical protein PVA45_08255 (plasmid) [Entomospira entomophila]|uniref:Uncharacterized protein n=1 Tax=Entomospira entomophila TaxID=2719988 RepID=A0A968KX69_9SPIO|nr:hypothetical protein [Entomospira entomophilus]NIZ41550.1 hypothetical protein [Entomospira entomophilus]WDI36422.1 hypothetical protein PVA45_08255 [Entomospira entomophilus]